MSLADIERRLAQLDEQFQSLLAEAIDAEDKESCNTQFAEILAEQTSLKKQKETILRRSFMLIADEVGLFGLQRMRKSYFPSRVRQKSSTSRTKLSSSRRW